MHKKSKVFFKKCLKSIEWRCECRVNYFFLLISSYKINLYNIYNFHSMDIIFNELILGLKESVHYMSIIRYIIFYSIWKSTRYKYHLILIFIMICKYLNLSLKKNEYIFDLFHPFSHSHGNCRSSSWSEANFYMYVCTYFVYKHSRITKGKKQVIVHFCC